MSDGTKSCRLGFIVTLVALLDVANVAYAAQGSERMRLRRPRRVSYVTSTPTPAPTPSLETAFIPYWVVADGLARVQRASSRGNITSASISAARNEYEAFQIIVHAPESAALVSVNARATDLAGPSVVANSNVTLYREHYVQVTTSSPGSPYAPGEWPDALIPFVNPETGQRLSGGRFPAAPFDVPAGKNQPIFVEIRVPTGTAAGVYTGRIVLTATGYTNTEVPVTLRVRNFELPQRASLRSKFTGYRETDGAAEFLGLRYGDPQRRVMAERFNRFLLDHRLSPNTPNDTAPYIDRATGHIDTRYSDAMLRHYFEDLKATGWTIPFAPDWPWPDPTGADRGQAVTYLTEMADYLSANGWFERTYVELYDEPNSADAYAAIRNTAALVHSVRPDYRVLVTEQPKPDDPAWGSLDGAVEVWVPLTTLFDEPSASAAIGRGEEVWSYTEAAAFPAWLIDSPLLNERTPAWISWRYGQTGLLYWTPWYWEEANPWDSAANYTVPSGTYNGNGCLVYPGNDVGYTAGPVASLRLKALRDGVEDYEYLKLLSDLGDNSFADGEAFTVGSSWGAPTTDPSTLQAARARLANRIESLLATRS